MRGVFVALCLATASPASAALINGREWVFFSDLPSANYRTTGAELAEQYDSNTGLCKLDWCGFGSNDYTDYVWASTSEVNDLFYSFGFGLASTTASHLTAYLNGSEGVGNFFNTLGASVPGIEASPTGPIGAYRTLGWTRTQSSPDTRHLVYLTDFRGPSDLTDYVGLSTSNGNDAFWVSLHGMPQNMSVQAWLYKPTPVPEPETYALLLLGGLAAYLGRRRTRPRQSIG